jgi:hypothetical protein
MQAFGKFSDSPGAACTTRPQSCQSGHIQLYGGIGDILSTAGVCTECDEKTYTLFYQGIPVYCENQDDCSPGQSSRPTAQTNKQTTPSPPLFIIALSLLSAHHASRITHLMRRVPTIPDTLSLGARCSVHVARCAQHVARRSGMSSILGARRRIAMAFTAFSSSCGGIK